VAYTAANKPGQAAVEFEQISQSLKETPEVQREATLQAADLYDKAGNAAKSRAMLEAFVKHFPHPGPALGAQQIEPDCRRAGDYSGRDYGSGKSSSRIAPRAPVAPIAPRLAAKATLTLIRRHAKNSRA
jgi:hypothetical protein